MRRENKFFFEYLPCGASVDRRKRWTLSGVHGTNPGAWYLYKKDETVIKQKLDVKGS